MGNTTNNYMNKEKIKKDIEENYLTGKSTLMSIAMHHKIKMNDAQKIHQEMIHEHIQKRKKYKEIEQSILSNIPSLSEEIIFNLKINKPFVSHDGGYENYINEVTKQRVVVKKNVNKNKLEGKE